MPLPQLYSRRKRAASGVVNDVYTYDDIPQKVRIQIVHLITEGLGPYNGYAPNTEIWEYIVRTMRKEKGVFHLSTSGSKYDGEYANWLLTEPDIDSFLDGVELAFRGMSLLMEYQVQQYEATCAELNARLREAGIGYELQSGHIIKIDTQLIHSEVVVPALKLLHDQRFAGANNEFLDAHSHFRAGDYESCLAECCKALESVLKVIGARRKWQIGANDPASKLIAAAFSSGFVPPYMQTQFNSLRSMLESGVPAVRNKMSGHGAGGQVRQVDKHLAAYQLHQTAAAIVFLVEHDKATP